MPSNDPSLSRRSTLPFGDRTSQFINNPMNISTVPSEPFQIKIDTHIIQKDMGGPMSTFTTTALGNPSTSNMPSLSPLKR